MDMCKNRILTKEQVQEKIEKCKLIHNDKYSYEKVEYINYNSPVIITCPVHGDFLQNFYDHSIGRGCRICANKIRNNKNSKGKEDFIKKCNEVHESKYSYEKVPENVKMRDVVIVTCPVHGDFEQVADSHKRGSGCPFCVGKAGRDKERGIKIRKKKYDELVEKIHGSDVKIVNLNENGKVILKCRHHGEIKKNIGQISKGQICGKCLLINNKKKNTEISIQKLNEIHNGKYEYLDLPDIVKNNTILKVRCIKHDNIYHIKRDLHMVAKYGGCEYCQKENKNVIKLSKEEILERFNMVHGDRYSYDKLEYVKYNQKVIITCKKHGDFFQVIGSHFKGSGCPSCSLSQGEKRLHMLLNKMGLKFIQQKIFYGCINEKTGRHLPFDVYIPRFHTCIEFDGSQHFEPSELWGGKEAFDELKLRDDIKNKYCELNEIELIRIPYYMEWENVVKLLNEKFNKNIKVKKVKRYKWFEKNILEITKKYKTKSDFMNQNYPLYKYCSRNGLLKLVSGHMTSVRHDPYKLEDFISLTQKYDNYRVFYKEHKNVAVSIQKKNLSYLTDHMYRDRIIWTDEMIIKELKKYKDKMDLRYRNFKFYNLVLRRGFIYLLENRFKRWDEDKVIDAFKNSKSLSDLKKRFRGAENYAKKKGLYKKYVELYLNTSSPLP